MEHIIARQDSAAKPATGKTFLVGIAAIILELSLAQLVVNLLIRLTGLGLLNILFYALAVVLLVRFMTRTVAGNIYILRDDVLIMQRLMGDSTVLGVEIGHGDILAIRPLRRGEKLELDYRQVTYVDTTCAPGLRMRAAFLLSLVCAWLARLIAGRAAQQENGYVVAYMENGKRSAGAFRPDEAFLAALKDTLPEVFDRDERGGIDTYAAKSLRRAFGDLYAHVPDVVTQEELAFERKEFARRREARAALLRKIKGKRSVKTAGSRRKKR